MEANELKMGNLVDRNGLMEITGITKAAVWFYDNVNKMDTANFKLDKFTKPIPLTEKWLIKCGFEKLNTDTLRYEKDNLIVEWLFERWTGRLYVDCDTSIQIIELKSVHQLQNLYFSLTETELTIKK